MLRAALPFVERNVAFTGRRRDFDINAIDAAAATERELRCGDIHDDGGFAAAGIGKGPPHDIRGGTIVDEQLQFIPGMFAETFAGPDGIPRGEMLQEGAGVCRNFLPDTPGAFRLVQRQAIGFGDQVQTD